MKTDLKQIEADILIRLSDFIPRNQNQITNLIGKDHNNSTDRVHIHRAIKNLEPYLERVPNQLDDLGKKWTLRQHIETTRQIVENYPSLIFYLQRNQIIINQLFAENKTLNNVLEIPVRDFFANMIQLSPTFFKTILVQKSFDNFKKIWIQFNLVEKFDAEGVDLLLYLELIKHSIINDYIEGNDMQKAIAYIKENEPILNIPYFVIVAGKIIEGLQKGFERTEENRLKDQVQLDPEIEAKIREEVKEESKKMEEEWMKKRGYIKK